MHSLTTKGVVLVASAVLAAGAGAAEVRLNGFASVVGGMTIDEGDARDRFTGAPEDATYSADLVTEGVYDDDLSFKPDSNYGLQISADLGDGLRVVGQLTGNGGEDFETTVSWAYVSYDLDENWTLQAGRQRLPLFFYSDFIDVGYAYHWIRPPQDLAAASVDTFEGLNVAYSGAGDVWDWRWNLYGGAASEEIGGAGNVEGEDMIGSVLKIGNDWLQLRASILFLDVVAEALPLSSGGVPQATDEDPEGFEFYGVAAHMNWGDTFVVTEYTASEFDNALGPDGGVAGNDEESGWYVSAGIRQGRLTPHITYGERTTTLQQTGVSGSFDQQVEYWTLGLRWDFHPSAAAKIEYLTRSDESDSFVKNSFGVFGQGDAGEVDVVSFGVDVIF